MDKLSCLKRGNSEEAYSHITVFYNEMNVINT